MRLLDLKITPIAPIVIWVKLSEPLKVKSLQAPGYYAIALRAIGQDLAKLVPCDLEIETQSNGFIVRGHCPRGRLEAKPAIPDKPALHSLLGKLLGRPAQPARPNPLTEIVEFNLVYDSQDLDRLDQQGAKYRTGMNRIPDPRTLGEYLRTIGRLIDANNCQLTLLKKFADGVIIKYRDTNDQPQSEEITNFELYKLQRSYYGERGTFNPVDMWKGHET